MKTKKKTVKKKLATKKVARKATIKAVPLREAVSVSATPVDEKAVQEKYNECVSILGQLHNAITLALSLTDEYDHKTPVDLVQFALDQYKEFTLLSPLQIEELKLETEKFAQIISEAFPQMEVETTEVQQKAPMKKELMN